MTTASATRTIANFVDGRSQGGSGEMLPLVNRHRRGLRPGTHQHHRGGGPRAAAGLVDPQHGYRRQRLTSFRDP
jgi:hypothetical protein